jgi:hypothetical protein
LQVICHASTHVSIRLISMEEKGFRENAQQTNSAIMLNDMTVTGIKDQFNVVVLCTAECRMNRVCYRNFTNFCKILLLHKLKKSEYLTKVNICQN